MNTVEYKNYSRIPHETQGIHTDLDIVCPALVEFGHVKIDEASFGLVGLRASHGEQLTAALVLLQGIAVPSGGGEYTYMYVHIHTCTWGEGMGDADIMFMHS